ncbi:restriction endonuclease subunit S, partial [Ligilactobacillus salivarius]|nr:restriction endonuclease subunit S [Ligilactobacillus salivarius]
PDTSEQKEIGDFFKQLDSLIALHQRKPKYISKLT